MDVGIIYPLKTGGAGETTSVNQKAKPAKMFWMDGKEVPSKFDDVKICMEGKTRHSSTPFIGQLYEVKSEEKEQLYYQWRGYWRLSVI